MRIKLDCGHFYDHRTPVELLRAADTVMGVGIKPPKKCPACQRAEQNQDRSQDDA